MNPLDRVGEALGWASRTLRQAGCASPRMDAEVLLAHVTGLGREHLLAHPERPLAPQASVAFAELVALRERRCPVAYLTGRREFMSLDMRVGPGVLVPRPETELLVEVARDLTRRLAGTGRRRIADVATGSGAVAVALAVALGPTVEVHATDISPAALAYAARNARAHEVSDRVELHQGDLLQALSPGLVLDGVVANLPYVADAEWQLLPPEVRDWEPPESLAGGPDGLELYRRLVSQLPGRLAPGGFLALEVGAGQAPAISELLRGTGRFREVARFRDLGGIERVVAGIPVPAQDKNIAQNVVRGDGR